MLALLAFSLSQIAQSASLNGWKFETAGSLWPAIFAQLSPVLNRGWLLADETHWQPGKLEEDAGSRKWTAAKLKFFLIVRSLEPRRRRSFEGWKVVNDFGSLDALAPA